MQPADPMGIPVEDNNNNELPEHLPPQMAFAPEQNPYGHSHVIRSQGVDDDDDDESEAEKHRRKLASHSLSPEQLGITGYVKDVAGFVKDAYRGARDRKSAHHITGEQDSSGKAQEPQSPQATTASLPPQQQQQQQQPQSARASSPLADAVTRLFPGLDPNAQGCSHADELRHNLMQQHSQDEDVTQAHHMLHER